MTTMIRKGNNKTRNHHAREKKQIVPPLCSSLCPHSVIPASPLTRKNKMSELYTKQNISMLKQQVRMLVILWV